MRLSLSSNRWSRSLLLLVCALLFLSGLPVSSEARSHAERNSARRLMAEMSEDEIEETEETDSARETGSDDDPEEVFDFRMTNFENADLDDESDDAVSDDESDDESDDADAGRVSKSKKRSSATRSSSKNGEKKKGSASGSSSPKKRPDSKTDREDDERNDQKSGVKTRKKDSGKSSASGSRSGKSSRTKSKRNAKKEAEPEDTRTPEEKERDRRAYFEQTGIWRWPELTETQFETEIEKQKKYLEEIKAKFPRTVYYESEHFFYLTDAPKPIALECMKYLEAMFARLCEMFEFPKGSRVWHGKCIVCAFAFQQDFLRFEQEFFGATADKFTGASGLAHMSSDGNVLISLFYGNISAMAERWRFIGVLVHESTHGFMHRYRARQSLPLWLEEGIADTMPAVIVPADRQAALKQRSGLNQMRQTGSVGGLMQSAGPLEAWQYGVASGLVQFMLKQNPHGFKEFLDSIKDGKDWVEALKETYRCTPEELLFHFGRANRIPRLTF